MDETASTTTTTKAFEEININDNNETTNNKNKNNTTFDHVFSGWSVWLEPGPLQHKQLTTTMNDLAHHCYGKESSDDNNNNNSGVSVPTFDPHCTLLYNFPSLASIVPTELLLPLWLQKRREKMTCMEWLERSVKKFRASAPTPAPDAPDSNIPLQTTTANTATTNDDAGINIQLIPKSFYFFPYPKEADGGKGFGCVIAMILLENNEKLLRMHHATVASFPSDQRHGQDSNQQNQNDDDDDGGANDDTNDDNSNDELKGCKLKGENFIPHMALVYAPETYHNWLKLETKKMNDACSSSRSPRHPLLNPMKARYMSVWSTEGQIKDWRLIARIEL